MREQLYLANILTRTYKLLPSRPRTEKAAIQLVELPHTSSFHLVVPSISKELSAWWPTLRVS